MKIFVANLKENIECTCNTVFDLLNYIDYSEKKNVLVAKKNNNLVDWDEKISDNDEIEFLTFDSEEGKEVYRHTTSHIMAQAVKRLFPDAKVTIGPSIKDGFYYDFDVEKPFTESDLEKIEKEMYNIINEDLLIERKVLTKREAVDFFKKENEDYKVEIINEIEDDTVSLYTQGDFTDLCRGPHLRSTGKVRVVKLLKVAGAYWRGNEKNKMLQRIYGTSWYSEKQLKVYLKFLKEAEERDHRRLGKELDIFSVQEIAGPGLIYWHPNGAALRHSIETFWKEEHIKRGYQLLYTPHIAKKDLWVTSGHWDNYRENIYSPIDIDNQQYLIKPMNCPMHILIYKSKIRSYRELPIRWAELGTVYRYERSGVLHGMLRVRGFTQDDAHIFCTEEQLESEIIGVLDLTDFMLTTFGFKEYEVMLSTRPEKFAGTEEGWDRATQSLRDALDKKNIKYKIDEGGGAFYGPKIDIKLIDALNRGWQGPTIQVDFVLPERFDVNYVGEDGKEHRVVMIHRAVLGSFERFVGTLIEHYKGAFPVWLAPVQVIIIPISDEQIEYGKKLADKLRENLVRVETDFRSDKMGYKIREAIKRKIPFLFIVGQKEVSENKVSVRTYKEGDKGVFSVDDAVNQVINDIKTRKIN